MANPSATLASNASVIGRRNELIESNLFLARDVARKISVTIPKSFELADLISDGYLGLIRAASTYDGRTPFAAYASKIIRWEIYSAIRRKAYEENTRCPLPELVEEAGAEPDREAEIDAERLRERVAHAVGELDPRHREVIRLHYHKGLAFAAIGSSYRVGRSRASKLHMEGIRTLRGRLAVAVAG